MPHFNENFFSDNDLQSAMLQFQQKLDFDSEVGQFGYQIFNDSSLFSDDSKEVLTQRTVDQLIDYVLYKLIETIIGNLNLWNRYTEYSTSRYSEDLFIALNDNDKSEVLLILFTCMYEVYLSLPPERALPNVISNILIGIIKKPRLFDNEPSYQLEHRVTTFPMFLNKYLINHSVLKKLPQVEDAILRADKLNNEISSCEKRWSDSLDKREKTITEIESRLKDHETQYNFVGLTKAFIGMAFDKKNELVNAERKQQIWMNITLLIPLVAIMFMILGKPDKLWVMAPFTTLLFLCIYFFRITASEVKSIKSQLLQIEQRKALCQFVEKFVEYKQDISNRADKKLDSTVDKSDGVKNPLEKFEDMIFSSIVMTDTQIPSTFDGMDQLSKLLSSIGKGK